MFAILMGLTRWFYGSKGNSIPLRKFIVCSAALCVVSYLVAVFSPVPVLSLIACGVCGLSVGIMWPGVFSLSTEYCPQGGTVMFGLLALAGDIGCASGPSVVGFISDAMGGHLKSGLLVAIVFPAALMIGVHVLKKVQKNEFVQ
jgi:MFS family permease